MLLFFNATVTTQIYTLSLHDALPITEIKTFFTRKNSCEHIFDYDYRIFRNERTVRLVMSQINDQPCDSLGEAVYHTLKFRPEHHGKYIFHRSEERRVRKENNIALYR